MDIEHKTVGFELKAIDEKGEGVLRFIRFEQEDKDGDITRAGFIGQQPAILIAAHNWKSDYPPLGRGESFEADGATNFRFKLNLEDPRARTWHSWLKMDRAMGGSLQQVSYGFSPHADGQEKWSKNGRSGRFLKPRPDGSPGAELREVSFVVVGSGNDTAVLDVKSTDALLSGTGTKESRGMSGEPPIIEPSAAPHVEPDVKADTPPEADDYTQYPEDRRPPLPVLTKWLRLYRYHLPFLRDIRKRDGKEISPETIAEFTDVVHEVNEVATLLNIKVRSTALMPKIEEEAERREWYDVRLRDLTSQANAEEVEKLKSLQAEALELNRKAEMRSKLMRHIFQS